MLKRCSVLDLSLGKDCVADTNVHDILTHTSGDHEKLLLAYISIPSSEGPKFDRLLADQDARALYKAGEKRWGTDETRFKSIFSERSRVHLAAVSSTYKIMYGNTLRKLEKQQEEAEKEQKKQRRCKKEEAQQKMELALQKHASVLERFLKKSKTAEPSVAAGLFSPVEPTSLAKVVPNWVCGQVGWIGCAGKNGLAGSDVVSKVQVVKAKWVNDEPREHIGTMHTSNGYTLVNNETSDGIQYVMRVIRLSSKEGASSVRSWIVSDDDDDELITLQQSDSTLEYTKVCLRLRLRHTEVSPKTKNSKKVFMLRPQRDALVRYSASKQTWRTKRDPQVLIFCSSSWPSSENWWGLMAGVVECQMKNALEWLRSERVEYQRLVAILILKVSDFVVAHMSSKGIDLHTKECHHVIKYVDGSFSLKTNKGTTDGFSHVMFGTGHKPNTKCQLFNMITRYAKRLAIQTSSCFAKGVMVHITVTVSILHTRMSAEDLVPETYKMS
ncbi:annexin D5-like protein [Tanacetum coccineum]